MSKDNSQPDLLQAARWLTKNYMKQFTSKQYFSDSDEVFSAALLTVTRLSGTWKPTIAKWSTYLFNHGPRRLSRDMARHLYWTKRRQGSSKTEPVPLTFTWGDVLPDFAVCTYNGHDRVDDKDEVDWLMSKLSKRDQLVIRLKWFENLSLKQIAKRINHPATTVWWQVFRAEKRMRAAAKEKVA